MWVLASYVQYSCGVQRDCCFSTALEQARRYRSSHLEWVLDFRDRLPLPAEQHDDGDGTRPPHFTSIHVVTMFDLSLPCFFNPPSVHPVCPPLYLLVVSTKCGLFLGITIFRSPLPNLLTACVFLKLVQHTHAMSIHYISLQHSNL